ncbi:MAG: A24 family peptidase [Lachnospiraceae bacterium]|nr:A24 family peptidase [Lachnospiraceae bacterium]
MDIVFLIPFCTALILAAVTDQRTGQIPPFIVGYILFLAIIQTENIIEIIYKMTQGIAIFLPLFLLFFLTGKLGGGDIKLIFAVTLCLGWETTLKGLFIACIAVLVLQSREKGKGIAFGPYLAPGFMMMAFFSALN